MHAMLLVVWANDVSIYTLLTTSHRTMKDIGNGWVGGVYVCMCEKTEANNETIYDITHNITHLTNCSKNDLCPET